MKTRYVGSGTIVTALILAAGLGIPAGANAEISSQAGPAAPASSTSTPPARDSPGKHLLSGPPSLFSTGPGAPAPDPAKLKESVGVLPAFDFRSIDLYDGSEANVNLASHNVVLRTTDIAFSDTDSDYAVERYYNSFNADETGAVGKGWNLSFGQDVRLVISSGESTVLEQGPTGSRVLFTKQPNGTYTAPHGVGRSLQRTSEGWTLSNYSTDTVSTYSPDGLEQRREINGGAGFVDVAYDAISNRAVSLTDNTGRVVDIAYNSDGFVESLSLQSATIKTFTYNSNGQITSSTTLPSDTSGGYHRTYQYRALESGATMSRVSFFDGPLPIYLIGSLHLTPSYRGTADGPAHPTPHNNGVSSLSVSVDDYAPTAPPDTKTGTTFTFGYDLRRTKYPLDTYEFRRNTYVGAAPGTIYSVTQSPEFDYEFDRDTFAVERADGLGRTLAPPVVYTPGPVVSITGALHAERDTEIADGQYVLAWSASDPLGVSGVTVSVNGEEVDAEPQDCASGCSTASGTWTFDTDEWDPGEYKVHVEGTNQAGVPSSRSFVFTVPEGPDDTPDPEVDGPEIDPATSPVIDGSICEQHYGLDSDYCFEDAAETATADALDARRAPELGPTLTGIAAGPAARAADPLSSADIQDGPDLVAPFSTSTKTLIYGISQGELSGNSAVPQDTSYFGAPIFTDLKVKNLRVLVPYNLMDSPARVANFRTVYEQAVDSGTTLMVSLNFRCRPTDVASCYSAANQNYRPSQADYVQAISAFKAAFPRVRYLSAFNEPNLGSSPLSRSKAGKTNGPRRAALYTFLVTRNVCGKVAPRQRSIPCSVVAADYAGANWKSYQKVYRADLAKRFDRINRSGDMPTIWAFHPYPDVSKRTTPSRSQTAQFARTLPGGSRIWLNEVGGRNHDADSNRLTDAQLEDQQADRVRYLFDRLSVSRKSISRVYYYTLCVAGQEPSSPPDPADHRTKWDSALLGTFASPSGPVPSCASQPTREAWRVFRNRSEEAG